MLDFITVQILKSVRYYKIPDIWQQWASQKAVKKLNYSYLRNYKKHSHDQKRNAKTVFAFDDLIKKS